MDIDGRSVDSNNHDEPEHKCEICTKVFTMKQNLTRHIRNIHQPHTNTIKIKYTCHRCSKSFDKKFNLQRHILRNCSSTNRRVGRTEIKIVHCAICDFKQNKSVVLKHYSNEHNINVEVTTIHFLSTSEYEEWKNKIERETVSKFIKFDSTKTSNSTILYYRCHKDGKFIGEGKDISNIKLLGSDKIGAYCPAKIDAKVSQNGEVFVKYLSTHVGHTGQLGKVLLPKSEALVLPEKVTCKTPIDEIINSVCDNIADDNLNQMITDIRKKHKYMLRMKRVAVSNSDKTWLVTSLVRNEMYTVQAGNLDCLCHLKCDRCKVCIHAYTCSCVDSSIKWNMCKHIHLVCNHQQLETPQQVQGPNLGLSEVPVDTRENEKAGIFKQLTKTEPITKAPDGVDTLKAKLQQDFTALLADITSIEECKVLQTALLPVRPTLVAMKLPNNANSQISDNTGESNNKILSQRNVKCNIKKRSDKLDCKYKIPTVEEMNNLGVFSSFIEIGL